MNAIQVENLFYTYPDGTKALCGLNLEIYKKSRVAILGANGSGKTTLIYHLNGLILPQEGSIRILGLPAAKKNLPSIRKQVGLLFDNPDNQLISSTVFNDVAFGPRNMRLPEEGVKEKVFGAMDRVGILELQDKPPFNLSLGQKKKVAIAGLLAMDSQILIFDEPFSGLDPSSAQQVTGILQTLNEEGRTLVISTHDVNMAYAWAEQVIILSEGRLLKSGGISLLRDRELMKRACLEVPVLAEAFAETGVFPQNAAQASTYIKKIILSGACKIS